MWRIKLYNLFSRFVRKEKIMKHLYGYNSEGKEKIIFDKKTVKTPHSLVIGTCWYDRSRKEVCCQE